MYVRFIAPKRIEKKENSTQDINYKTFSCFNRRLCVFIPLGKSGYRRHLCDLFLLSVPQ